MTEQNNDGDEDETVFITKDVAEKLDGMIRETADALQDAADEMEEQWVELKRLVREAKAGGIWEVLGHKSWSAYLADAVGLNPGNIEERNKCVEFLVSEGLPQRAIAKMLNVGVATVNRSIAQLIHDGTVDEIAAAMGLDGRVRPRQKTGLERERKSPDLTPTLRYQKVYNSIGLSVSKLADRISNDADFASAASSEIDRLAQLRDDLTKAIKQLRALESAKRLEIEQ